MIPADRRHRAMEEAESDARRKLLEADAERMMEMTGWGLAATWGLIHAGQYDRARERLILLEELWYELDGSEFGDDIDRP